MNTSNDPDEALTREYRQASATGAGAPSAGTRAAILAEARAAALRRQPAANDSRVLWRAAAGVAVLGVALLLWRQADPRLPASAPPVAATLPTQVDSQSLSVADSPAGTPAANESATSAERSVPAAPATPARASRAAESVASAQVPDGAALLRQAFPDAFLNAESGTSVWVLRDSADAIVRSGTLAATEDLQGVMAALQREFPDRQFTGWSSQTARNARGVPFELHIAELRQDQVRP